VNRADTQEPERTFSELTFSNVFRMSITRVSICGFSRDLAAEKAARCGRRLICSLENEEEATWRVVTLRKARRRNDMRYSFTARPCQPPHTSGAPCRGISFSAWTYPRSEKTGKQLYSSCYGGCHELTSSQVIRHTRNILASLSSSTHFVPRSQVSVRSFLT
jgi:hypothetical protein